MMDHGFVTHTSRAGPWKSHHHCIPRERNDCHIQTCLSWGERLIRAHLLAEGTLPASHDESSTADSLVTARCQQESDFTGSPSGGDKEWSGYTLWSGLWGFGGPQIWASFNFNKTNLRSIDSTLEGNNHPRSPYCQQWSHMNGRKPKGASPCTNVGGEWRTD